MQAQHSGVNASVEETLDPEDWNGAQALSHQIVDDAVAYLRDVRDRPVWRAMPDDVRSRFSTPLPRAPESLASIYQMLTETVMRYPMGNVHPRFWAWYIARENNDHLVLADL